MTMKNEKRFYAALEKLFVGAGVEGEGGFVNLLAIKASYYKGILKIFKADVDRNGVIPSFREEFFDRLYSFFEKYFSECGSVYFAKTANWQNVYEKVYTDSKDVVLFWKTNMLYYVKSDILFRNIDVTVTEEDGTEHRFYFDCGALQNKQNNEKKELIFTPRPVEGEKHILDVAYSSNGARNKTEENAKAFGISPEVLKKAEDVFKKQNAVDFFINKDARRFLTEQLNLYLHQMLLDEKNEFDADRLAQFKTVKEFALKIIDFIAQFENELVKIWNKPKFALNSNYVITLDRLPGELIEKLKAHSGWTAQRAEWAELGIDENGARAPVDTKHFKDLEGELLALFGNLDEALDGRLIHSENYQALNTLQARYGEQVQCVYIDPPFNTGSDFQYIDRYRDSSWLSIMNDRVALAHNLLSMTGSFYLHLDERANYLGRMISNNYFPKLMREIIWDIQALSGYKTQAQNFVLGHQSILFYVKDEQHYLFNKQSQPHRKEYLERFDKTDENGKRYFDGRGNIIYLEEAVAKGKAVGDVWYDIMSFQQNSTSKEKVPNSTELTQKPEELLARIIKSSSDPKSLVLDFFSGSGTTVTTAHKLGRKWLGVELGDHCHDTIIPRLKEALAAKSGREPAGITSAVGWQGGGFFKYYELEQYEDTLRRMKYNKDAVTIFDMREPFRNYVFRADSKLADVLEIQIKASGEESVVNLDFDALYPGIDFAETISLLKGRPIKKITPTGVLLDGEKAEIRTDYRNMTAEEKVEFVKLLKPLLWWGE